MSCFVIDRFKSVVRKKNKGYIKRLSRQTYFA